MISLSQFCSKVFCRPLQRLRTCKHLNASHDIKATAANDISHFLGSNKYCLHACLALRLLTVPKKDATFFISIATNAMGGIQRFPSGHSRIKELQLFKKISVAFNCYCTDRVMPRPRYGGSIFFFKKINIG